MKLSLLTLPQRIAIGAGIVVLLVAGLLWYRHALIEDGYAAGKAEAELACETATNKAIADALAAHQKKQAEVDEVAASEEAKANTAGAFEELVAQMAALRTNIRSIRNANPLPADCRAGPDRMRVVAEARSAR